MKPSAALAIDVLREHPEGLTRLTAAECGVGNMPARVIEARAEGWVIRDEWVTTPAGARIKRWRLIGRRHQPMTGVQLGASL